MTKKVFLGTMLAFALPLMLRAETWKGVPVVDSMC